MGNLIENKFVGSGMILKVRRTVEFLKERNIARYNPLSFFGKGTQPAISL